MNTRVDCAYALILGIFLVAFAIWVAALGYPIPGWTWFAAAFGLLSAAALIAGIVLCGIGVVAFFTIREREWKEEEYLRKAEARATAVAIREEE